MTQEHRTTEEEMKGPTFILRIKEQETRLILQEHADDDDEVLPLNTASRRYEKLLNYIL